MPKETLACFIVRHRFRPGDIIPNVTLGISTQHANFLKLFPNQQTFFGILFDRDLVRLRHAFYLAQYMSGSAIDQPNDFARLVSLVDDEAWSFALTFSPFHKVSAALQNLKLVEGAMLEAALALNAAMAGMESAIEFPRDETRSYEREASKATINLLNYSALYASYVDVCRRLREYTGLKESRAYNRAISKIIGLHSGEHEFIRSLRNFMLHYHLVQPHLVIEHGNERKANLLLDADNLLRDGFKWSAGARIFLASKRKLNIIEITRSVSRDVSRLVNFHLKLVDRYLKQEKQAYQFYRYERSKSGHLSRSMTNIEAIFQLKPRPIITKLLDQKVIEDVLSSSLSDAKVRSILGDLANRHKNLPPEIKRAIDREIADLLSARIRFPATKPYIRGRPFQGGKTSHGAT